MSGFIYPDAHQVWRLFKIISESMELQQAATLRFDLSTRPQVGLTLAERRLITPLSIDKLITVTSVQASLDKYFSEQVHREEWTQQLNAHLARLKTLELRAGNLDQELSKGGLFRGKKIPTPTGPQGRTPR